MAVEKVTTQAASGINIIIINSSRTHQNLAAIAATPSKRKISNQFKHPIPTKAKYE